MTKYLFKNRKLAEALYGALNQDPYFFSIAQTVSGSNEEKKEGLLRYLDYAITEGEQFGEVYYPDNQSGASIWAKPLDITIENKKTEEKKNFLQEFLGEETLVFYEKVIAFMDQKMMDLVPADSWYLSVLGLKPSFQNKGLGKTLLNPIIEKTDKMGVSTYLETFNPKNVSFYKRLNYKEITTFHEPTINSEYLIMTRLPL